MKAAVWTDIGKVEIREVPTPVPGKGKVLVKVKSAGICSTDIHIIHGILGYGKPPHILGHEIAGEIAALGEDTGKWKIGDRVVIDTMIGCGDCYYCKRGMRHLCDNGGEIGHSPNPGGYAEYTLVPCTCLQALPDEVSYDEAGIMESFICPAGSIFRLGMQFGETVLIQGAGPAGLAFLQTAKVAGAGKVIVAARNADRLNQAVKFGADVVIDIEKENIEERVMEETCGQGADISIEAAGFPASIGYSTKLARKNGRVILYGIPGDNDQVPFPVLDIIIKQLSVHGAVAYPHVWEPVIALTAQGKFNLKDMVTHRFSLDEFVQAVEWVSKRRDGVIKAVIKP